MRSFCMYKEKRIKTSSEEAMFSEPPLDPNLDMSNLIPCEFI